MYLVLSTVFWIVGRGFRGSLELELG